MSSNYESGYQHGHEQFGVHPQHDRKKRTAMQKVLTILAPLGGVLGSLAGSKLGLGGAMAGGALGSGGLAALGAPDGQGAATGILAGLGGVLGTAAGGVGGAALASRGNKPPDNIGAGMENLGRTAGGALFGMPVGGAAGTYAGTALADALHD